MSSRSRRSKVRKSRVRYPYTCPKNVEAIREHTTTHPACNALRHARMSAWRSRADLLTTARRLLRSPTCSSTPTAARALPYVTDTKCLERQSSTEHRGSDAGGASSRQLQHRCPPAPLRVTSSSHSPTFVSRAIGTGLAQGLVNSTARGTIGGLDD